MTTLTPTLETAAHLCASAVSQGDLEGARFWALEFAEHRDSDLTRAERTVSLKGYADRNPLGISRRGYEVVQ